MVSEPAAPRPVRVAGVLVGLQGLLAGLAAVLLLVRALTGSAGLVVLGGALLFAVFAAGLIAIARGLLLGQHGARGPAVVVQLLLLPVVYSLLGPSDQVVLGILAALVVGGILVALFTGPARAWAAGGGPARREDG